MTTVAEATAAFQTAAGKKNALDAKLSELHAEERALSDQIGRAIADDADPKSLTGPKAQRDTLRANIEDAESAQVHVDADVTAAELALKAAQQAERVAALKAVIDKARASATAYTKALAAFFQARSDMRAIASQLPGQEAAVQQLVEDVVTFGLYSTPSNAVYGRPFGELVEPYLEQARTT